MNELRFSTRSVNHEIIIQYMRRNDVEKWIASEVDHITLFSNLHDNVSFTNPKEFENRAALEQFVKSVNEDYYMTAIVVGATYTPEFETITILVRLRAENAEDSL